MNDKTKGLIEALEPCPFCGGDLTITKHFKEALWRAVHRCPVVGAIQFDWSGNPDRIVTAWNTRALQPIPQVGGGDRGSLPPIALHGPKCSGNVKPDTDAQVFFYEQDFYVLSNFSAFSIMWPVSARDGDKRFDTSEAVYHFEKFICRGHVPTAAQRQIAEEIRLAPSAHEAFKIAERNKAVRRPDWDLIKAGVMKDIIRAKADQHEYVRRKLLATGDRELIEDSWRDDVWGWGPNRDGQNLLGKLWMEVRAELRGDVAPTPQQASKGGSELKAQSPTVKDEEG